MSHSQVLVSHSNGNVNLFHAVVWLRPIRFAKQSPLQTMIFQCEVSCRLLWLKLVFRFTRCLRHRNHGFERHREELPVAATTRDLWGEFEHHVRRGWQAFNCYFEFDFTLVNCHRPQWYRCLTTTPQLTEGHTASNAADFTCCALGRWLDQRDAWANRPSTLSRICFIYLFCYGQMY